MGVGIYLKPVSKDGRSLIYIRVKKGSKVFRKTTSIKINPSDWDSRTFQVSAKVDNSIFINEKLDDISTRLKRGWNFFESGNYTWDEMIAYLGGNSNTKEDLISL